MLQTDIFVRYANEMADSSAEIIKNYFRKPITVDDKKDASPVTIADKESEACIRKIIETNFPDHGIIGEEYGSYQENRPFTWVIDPIDGTKAFISGKPSFGTLIALLHNGKPILGIINQPITKERWLGVSGSPSLFNNSPIKTRACNKIEQATLYTTDPDIFNKSEKPLFNNLAQKVKLLRYGADCYAYGLLALGFVDIVCESSLKIYDFAALIPIIEGAGGMITDWNGKALDINNQSGQALALGDKNLFDKTAKLLKA